MQPGADVVGQQAVPGDDGLLGDRRPAGQPEPGRDLTLVHLRALGQPGLLRVLGDHPVERLDVLQRAAHQQRVGDAVAVVGKHPHPGRGCRHRGKFGEPLALATDRHGADRENVNETDIAAQPVDLLDDAGGIRGRVRVRHGEHRRVPAQRGASGSATGASNMNGFDPFEWAGATGVSRFTNPKSAPSKTSFTSASSDPHPSHPSAGSLRSRAHRLMRNHIPANRKAHFCKLMGIRRRVRLPACRMFRQPR